MPGRTAGNSKLPSSLEVLTTEMPVPTPVSVTFAAGTTPLGRVAHRADHRRRIELRRRGGRRQQQSQYTQKSQSHVSHLECGSVRTATLSMRCNTGEKRVQQLRDGSETVVSRRSTVDSPQSSVDSRSSSVGQSSLKSPTRRAYTQAWSNGTTMRGGSAVAAEPETGADYRLGLSTLTDDLTDDSD